MIYISIDDRPCNALWPKLLLAGTPLLAGSVLIMPDRAYATSDLLPDIADDGRMAVSVDALCFGSLLASREDYTGVQEAQRKLDLLRKVRKGHPSIKINAFSVIMRASISALCKGDLSAYENMGAYSYYSGKADEETGVMALIDRQHAARYKSRIAPEIIQKYHAVRERNHQINMECVRLVSEGVLDSLMLLQEDAPIHGFHKKEQKELNRLIEELGVRDRVFLHNGADEGGMMSCARFLSEKKTKVTVLFTRCDGDFTALYEDRPFRDNLEDSMRYLNMERSNDCDSVLVIHTPKDGKQHEASAQNDHPDEIDITVKQVGDLIAQHRRVYLLDLAYSNGGSIALIYALKGRGFLEKIDGYSAWNTAGNSLGTILSQIVTDNARGFGNPEFKWARVLDDMLYQSIIRTQASRIIRASGDDPMCLKNKNNAEWTVAGLFYKKLEEENWLVKNKRWVDAHPDALDPSQSLAPYTCDIRLPWNRLFEADIAVKANKRKGN